MNSRFVDRDMLMRYHLGLAVGHIYTHSEFPVGVGEQESRGVITEGEEELEWGHSACGGDAGSDSEDSFEGCDDDTDGYENEFAEPDTEDSCDEELYATHEMYH